MSPDDDFRFPAWVNGRLYAYDEPAVSPFDLGFQLGLAVFDTLLHEDGCRYFEEEHLARLESGARALHVAWPIPWEPARVLDEYVAAIGGRDAALRLTLTRGVPGRGPTLAVGGRALAPPPAGGVVVTLEPRAKVLGDELDSVKSTNRLRNLLARERAQEQGAWEALLCTVAGDVSEGTVSNVFCLRDGIVRTPSLERGCLPGIQRELVLEELAALGLPTVVDRIELADLAAAAEVFLTNTTGRVIGVTRLLGLARVPGVARDLPGSAGELVQALGARIRAREERYRAERRATAR